MNSLTVALGVGRLTQRVPGSYVFWVQSTKNCEREEEQIGVDGGSLQT